MTKDEILRDTRYLASLLSAMVREEPIPEKPDEVSWQSVYSIANKHSLASAVFYSADSALRSELSSEAYAKCQRLHTVDFVKNMKQTEEFKKLTALFSENKIRFLPLKGFLMKALYPKPELRTMSDLDILIDKEDATRVKELLLSNGYSLEHDNELGVHDSYNKPPFMHVEIHKKLYQGSKYGINKAKEKQGHPYWYLMTDEDFLVFMLIHSKKHYEDGGCGIRAVLDHYLYVKKNADFVRSDAVQKRLKKEGLAEFFSMMDALSAFWFDGVAAETDISDIEMYTVSGGTYGTYENQTYINIKKRGKFGHIMSRLFPAPVTIRSRYRWVNKCIMLLPIGYIARIVQSVFNGRAKECADLISEADKCGQKYTDNNSENKGE